MTSAELIRAVGEALFGSRWRPEMAAALEVGDRPLRRWAASDAGRPDEVSPPAGIWSELLEMVDARQAQLSRVRDELERRSVSAAGLDRTSDNPATQKLRR
jgi:hypothetical protein